jgi:hypothetical protein
MAINNNNESASSMSAMKEEMSMKAGQLINQYQLMA